MDLLTSIRLDAAAQLLLNTKNSVAQISKSVGINDAKYFSKLFHNSYGMNPHTVPGTGRGVKRRRDRETEDQHRILLSMLAVALVPLVTIFFLHHVPLFAGPEAQHA